MKKFFSGLFGRLFSPSPSNKVAFHVEMSYKLYKDLERMRISAGHKDHREQLASMVALNRWVLQKLDEGRIIAAIDTIDKRYVQLGVEKIFPNLKETGNQNIETDDEDEDDEDDD